jgi:hypothetical protein
MDHYQEQLSQQELTELQADFPGFRISREANGEHIRLIAVRRRRGTSPHTVVAAEAAELRALLNRYQRG